MGDTTEAGHLHRRTRRELLARAAGQHGAPEAGYLCRHLLAQLRVLLLLRCELQAHLAQQVEQLGAESGRHHLGRAPLELPGNTVGHCRFGRVPLRVLSMRNQGENAGEGMEKKEGVQPDHFEKV